MKPILSRALSGALAVVALLSLVPTALAAETYYFCNTCKQQTATLTIIKEANCHEEGVDEYVCTNAACPMYNKSELVKVPMDPKNHDAAYQNNGNGTHSGLCTYHATHTTDVRITDEPHTYNAGGVCTRCLAVDYRDVKMSLPETMEQFISLNDSSARLSVGDVLLTAGSADLTGEYNLTYNWFYKGEQVGTGKTYAPPASVTNAVGTHQYACVVMAVPKSNASLQVITRTCTLTVRVEDLITAYATVGSGEEYMALDETNGRTPMSVEDQIYEAVYNRSNGQPDYVVFKDPPTSPLGRLDVLTDSRRYYFYSNNNRLSGVTFIPSGTGETGRYTVSFTAYDDRGKEFPGILTIMVEKYAGSMDVLYTTAENTPALLRAEEFEDYWRSLYPNGTLTRVNFTRLASASEGALYINYVPATRTGVRVKSGDFFYAAPQGTQYGLDQMSFVPAEGFTGYAAIPFEAYGENDRRIKSTRTGYLYVFVSGGQVSEINCRVSGDYPLSEADFLGVYQAAGGQDANFYIQLLNVPESGSLYVNYASGRGTRLTAASIHERPFYCGSNWGELIGDLTYVPGAAESEAVRYVAYDIQGRPLYAGVIRFNLLEEINVPYSCGAAGVAFQAKDFATLAGAKISNVSFTPPAAAIGSLYYDRTLASPGTAITSEGTRFYLTAPAGAASARLLERLTFVPAQGISGTVSIPFTAYEENGASLTGTVRITVAASTPPTNPTNPTNPTDPANPPASSISFKDVPNDSSTAWYYQPVMDLASGGVLGGFGDGTFRPNEAVTYCQALKMIMLAAGYPEQAPTGGHWASGYLDKAVADGLTTAKAEQLDKRIDRYTIATIAAKALDLPLPTGNTSPFHDMEMTHASALYVLSLYEAGIIKGSVDKDKNLVYYGANAIRRSEMAVIIWRMYNFKRTGNAEGLPA